MIVPDGEDGGAGIVEGNGGAEEARRGRVIAVVADVILGDEAEQEVLGEDHGLAHGLSFPLGEDDGLDGPLREPLEHRPHLEEPVLLLLGDPKVGRRRWSSGGSEGTMAEDGRTPEAGNGQSDGRHPAPATGSGGGGGGGEEGGVDGEGRGTRRRHLHHHGRREGGNELGQLVNRLPRPVSSSSFLDESRWWWWWYYYNNDCWGVVRVGICFAVPPFQIDRYSPF